MSSTALPPMPATTEGQELAPELNAGLQTPSPPPPVQPTGTAMIPPDHSDMRWVPDEQLAGARQANWEPASKMIHPQTQDARWVPESQANAAKAAGYADMSVPAAQTESHPFQGLGSAAGDFGKSLVSGGPVSLAQNVYRGITAEIPAVYRAYEASRQSGASIVDAYQAANSKAQEIQNAKNGLIQAVKEFNSNPNKAAWSAVLQLGMIALGGKLLGAGGEAGEAAEATATEGTAGAEAAAKPGIIRQVIQGKKTAQPGAQAGVRTVAQASTETAGTADESMAANIQNAPILKGNETVLDQPLAALKEKEAALYKKVDDAAGFDLKAEKTQLANDKYKLGQLGNTDPDVSTRGNLVESINDSQDRITAAETKLRQAGIDPKAADVVHQSRMAGEEFKKVLVRSSNADGSIDVDKLLTGSKNLRFTKYGDRLSQFAGPQNADRLINTLREAQRTGVQAVKWQTIAKRIGIGVGTGA